MVPFAAKICSDSVYRGQCLVRDNDTFGKRLSSSSRGSFADIRQDTAAIAAGCGRCGRTVMAIATPAMPIADDAT
jgi:hypothetical protein